MWKNRKLVEKEGICNKKLDLKGKGGVIGKKRESMGDKIEFHGKQVIWGTKRIEKIGFLEERGDLGGKAVFER